MAKMQRSKGAAAEREIAHILSDELGHLVKRKLGAARNGGSDIELPGWSLEIKRTEQWLSEFWDQAERQAKAEGNRPALIWRKSRVAWMVWIDLHDVAPSIYPARGHVTRMTLPAFCQLVRELH